MLCQGRKREESREKVQPVLFSSDGGPLRYPDRRPVQLDTLLGLSSLTDLFFGKLKLSVMTGSYCGGTRARSMLEMGYKRGQTDGLHSRSVR